MTGHTNRVWSVAFSPDGNQIVTTSEDQTVRIWDATTGEELHQLTGHTSYVSSAAFSPDGAWIVTASYDGTARIWPTSWEEALRLINEEKVRGVVRGLTEEEKRQYGFTE
ncbi:MAG: hypothetical protein GY792_37835 [Gammaproteobacteria bacterium]|nr:hypothetical protein [Gammaproteobacteria bacterium]